MTNHQEKILTRLAESKGYKIEKIGKGPHHGRVAIVHKTEGSRARSGIDGAEFSFSLEEAEDWLTKIGN